tara:strand:- start:1171 stop:1614 length:444 start_codon:yes stop_codon:yes gene_type:complete
MKLPILLGALLLSASPVVADDLVYLECETKSVNTTKDLKSNQIMKREETAEITHHKVDLANGRTASAKKPEWEEVKIVDGVAVLDEESTDNGVNISMKASWQIVPPGRLTGDGVFSNDVSSETYKIRGMCKAIDESVFEKALKESES